VLWTSHRATVITVSRRNKNSALLHAAGKKSRRLRLQCSTSHATAPRSRASGSRRDQEDTFLKTGAQRITPGVTTAEPRATTSPAAPGRRRTAAPIEAWPYDAARPGPGLRPGA